MSNETNNKNVKEIVTPSRPPANTTTANTNNPAAATTQAPNQVPQPGADIKGNVNVADFIKKTTTETSNLDSEQEARVKKAKLLSDAVNSRFYFENVQYVNSETGEKIGSKIRYTKDPNGKTIYDYMNDPEVTAHVGFKLMDEEDQQDGGIVNRQISIYWVNPVF